MILSLHVNYLLAKLDLDLVDLTTSSLNANYFEIFTILGPCGGL